MVLAQKTLLLPSCGLNSLNPLNSRIHSELVIRHLVMIYVPDAQGCYTSVSLHPAHLTLPVPYLHSSLTQKPLTHSVTSLLPRLSSLDAIPPKKPFVGCFIWFSFI